MFDDSQVGLIMMTREISFHFIYFCRFLIQLREVRGLMSANLSGFGCSQEGGISHLFCPVRKLSSVRVRKLLSVQQRPRTR